MLWKELADRDNSPVFFCRAGSLANDLKLWEQADKLFHEALAIDPRSAIALECLGQLWSEREDRSWPEALQQAEGYFLKALTEERNERVLTCLGSVYRRLDRTAEAKLVLEEALQINPNYEEAMFNLAENLGQNNPNAAIDWLNRAIQIDPNYSAAHRELGVHLVRQRKLLNAEYHLRRALELNPADYWAHMQLANLLGIQSRNLEAEQIYGFATVLHPEITEGREIFARFLDSIGKTEKANRLRKGSTR